MGSHGLPPELEAHVVGSVPVETANGIVLKERVYLFGNHHEVAGYGTHVRLLSGEQTLSHNTETVVEVELRPLPSDCYIG